MIRGMVAIIGRPNVGKSTLFNRMTKSDAAIVDDQPGVTRDRIYGTVWLDDDKSDGFFLIDTGGFEKDDYKFQPFADNVVWRQTEAAIMEADLIVLAFDGKSGLHPHDKELLTFLQRKERPHMVILTKIDGIEHRDAAWDFFELGVDDMPKISAAHNRGVVDLRESIAETLAAMPHLQRENHDPEARRISIIGRPNAGKSSILNRMIGEERAVVSEIAGTTRDTLDTVFNYNQKQYVLVDTAGIRRKSKISEKIESLSAMRAIRSIDNSDLIFLVIDATQGMTDQDARLAELAVDRYKPIVIVVNKWDLIPDKDSNSAKFYELALKNHFKTLAFVPMVFVSCLHNQRIHRLMNTAELILNQSCLRVDTATVNEVLHRAVQEHTPALIKGKFKRIKFYFATQVATKPPTIVIFCNVYNEIQESYIRYLVNRLRAELGFDEVPLRLIFRPKTGARKRDAKEAASLTPGSHGMKEHVDHFESNKVAALTENDLIDAAWDDADDIEAHEIEVDANSDDFNYDLVDDKSIKGQELTDA